MRRLRRQCPRSTPCNAHWAYHRLDCSAHDLRPAGFYANAAPLSDGLASSLASARRRYPRPSLRHLVRALLALGRRGGEDETYSARHVPAGMEAREEEVDISASLRQAVHYYY